MRRSIMLVLAGGLLLIGTTVHAQGVVDYPPASGHMQIIPPSLPAPGGVGSEYVETFPTFVPGYQPAPTVAQPVAPQATYRVPRARLRGVRGARTYSRGYNQAPAPYATQLPQGQLYWPGSVMAPGYTPYSRYQMYGQAYEASPYGSNFYGGYYKGFNLGFSPR